MLQIQEFRSMSNGREGQGRENQAAPTPRQA
jgi:hypothetical protein